MSEIVYFFYIVQSAGGRVGFGIATNIKDRNKHYASHAGDIVKFPFIYGGIRQKCKAIEKMVKREYADNIWIIDAWKTEWLNLGISADDLKYYVDQLINERHLGLELVKTDYDFTQE